MSGIRFQSRSTQYCDDNGVPLNGAVISFFVSGTSTPATVYTDDTLGTPYGTSFATDADGRQPADIFLDPAVSYRATYKTSAGATFAPDDDPVGGNDVTAAVQDHNNDLAAHYAATESQRGFVELANATEGANDDTSRAITGAVLRSAVRAIFFPVGTIYTTVTSTNPGTYIGGTWAAFGSGRVLVGLDSGQTEFDTVEETGGSKTNTLLTANLPSHEHPLAVLTNSTNNSLADPTPYLANEDQGGGGSDYVLSGTSTVANYGKTGPTGSATAVNNLQPYIVVYYWKRTA